MQQLWLKPAERHDLSHQLARTLAGATCVRQALTRRLVWRQFSIAQGSVAQTSAQHIVEVVGDSTASARTASILCPLGLLRSCCASRRRTCSA